jgi:hypothetical protein
MPDFWAGLIGAVTGTAGTKPKAIGSRAVYAGSVP